MNLVPDIVASILDETLPPEVTLFELGIDPPALWEGQRNRVEGLITNWILPDTSSSAQLAGPARDVAHASQYLSGDIG